MPDRRDDEAVITKALRGEGAGGVDMDAARAALASLSLRLQNAETALADYDSTVEQGIAELVERGDKDFTWKDRVADFVTVARSLRRRHRAALASSTEREPERVTHGRHCPCSACAREDWTRITGPCGMHGADCPNVYAPVAAEREPESETA